MENESPLGVLQALSNQLADATETAGRSVVRIDDGTRLTASGVIWSADGLIVATSHGVESDDDLMVELHDGARLSATVVGRDADTDLAVLQVQGAGLPAFDRSTSARPGQIALALGRPGQSGLQVTMGVLSAIHDHGAGKLIHTDAVFYPGFSGGALVDAEGKLLGLNNLMYRRGRGVTIGVGILEEVVGALSAGGSIQRGYLGVRAQAVEISPVVREKSGLTQEAGLLVSTVETGSAAEVAGLMLGDTLLEVDGQALDDVDRFRQLLRSKRAGQTVDLKVLRGGGVLELKAELQAQPTGENENEHPSGFHKSGGRRGGPRSRQRR